MEHPQPDDLDLTRIPAPPILPTGRKEEKEEQQLLFQMDRQDKMNAAVHACKRVLLVVCFTIIIIIILIRVYALMAPTCWQWLTPEQTTKIDEFFVHGTIGAIIAAYLGKYFRHE